MTATELKEQIEKMNSHVLFDYDGKNCGVDPIIKNEIAMWFGGEYLTARLEEVMQIKLFAGKSLNDIASEIEIYE